MHFEGRIVINYQNYIKLKAQKLYKITKFEVQKKKNVWSKLCGGGPAPTSHVCSFSEFGV